VLATVEDDGSGFDPALIPDPLSAISPQRRNYGLVLTAPGLILVQLLLQKTIAER
jgi:hypothetical protein